MEPETGDSKDVAESEQGKSNVPKREGPNLIFKKKDKKHGTNKYDIRIFQTDFKGISDLGFSPICVNIINDKHRQ